MSAPPMDALAADVGVRAPPNPAMRRYVLGVLLVAYTFNFVDRQILSVLLQSIKHDLNLSDQSLGFLSGFAFAAFYATLGIPLAIWADRGNRRNLITVALALWSAMTAVCGLAQNFWQLALARVGVGIGEAGCTPPAHSMLADLYAPGERATPLAVYGLGIPLGAMFGLAAGGWLNDVVGWRASFMLVGLPGLALAVLLRFTVAEPPRGWAEGRAPTLPIARVSVFDTLRFLVRRRAFMHMCYGGGLACFSGYGFLAWFPTFLMRSHGMKPTEIGFLLGVVIGVVGGIGMLLGGFCADRLGRRRRQWSLWTVAVAIFVAAPFALAGYLSSNPYYAIALFTLPIVSANFWQATTFAQTQALVPPHMRAQAAALMLFIANIIGLGCGPWAIGLVSDLLTPRFGADALRWSMLGFMVIAPWTAWHYFRGGQLLPGDIARVDHPE